MTGLRNYWGSVGRHGHPLELGLSEVLELYQTLQSSTQQPRPLHRAKNDEHFCQEIRLPNFERAENLALLCCGT